MMARCGYPIRFGTGKALHFNGVKTVDSGQYVPVADSSSLDITGDITIAAWVKPEQVDTQDVVKKAASTADGYELTLSTSRGTTSTDNSGGTNPCAFGRFNASNNYRIDT